MTSAPPMVNPNAAPVPRRRWGIALLLGFGVVLVLLLVVAGAGYWGLDSVKQETVSMLQGDAQISQFAALIKADTLELRRGEKDSFLNIDDAKKREEYVGTWKKWREQLKTQLAEIDKKNPLPVCHNSAIQLSSLARGARQCCARSRVP